ncbi:MAG: peptidylprolyl isomerase [Desulfobacterales bacterium]|nr:peptidylprolyl isomerase [Desulfobacterales bacterium]
MTQAKEGDTVKIHYTGKFDDGTVFDSSSEKEPLEFVIGDGQVIPGVEEAVIGMNPEEDKTVVIPPEKAYGEYHDDMVVEVDKTKFPEHIQPELGLELELKQEDGNSIFVIVTNVSDNEVTLDANHPLAGKDLTFEIQLMEIA